MLFESHLQERGRQGVMLALTSFLVQVFTFILQRKSPSGQKDPPSPQALAENDYREALSIMKTDVNHLLKVMLRQRLCLLPEGV